MVETYKELPKSDWNNVTIIVNRWREAFRVSFGFALFFTLMPLPIALLGLVLGGDQRLMIFGLFTELGLGMGGIVFFLFFSLIGYDILRKRPPRGLSLETQYNRPVTREDMIKIASVSAARAIGQEVTGTDHLYILTSSLQQGLSGASVPATLSIGNRGIMGMLIFPWKDIVEVQKDGDQDVLLIVRLKLFGITYNRRHKIRLRFALAADAAAFCLAIKTYPRFD